MMPAYDCGSPDCETCARAYAGTDRAAALAAFRVREELYLKLAEHQRDERRAMQ